MGNEGMRMGLFGPAAMTGGAVMIGWGMARPRTGNAQTEGALDSVLLGGGAVLTAGGMAWSVSQGNDKGGKGKK